MAAGFDKAYILQVTKPVNEASCIRMVDHQNLFWELLEPEYIRGMMFCRKLTGNRDEGDDLYQDALVLAYTNFPELIDRGAFRTWFYRILINKFKSNLRRPWWKRRSPMTPAIETEMTGANPVDRHEARRWLERAFMAVSAEEKSLVTLYEMEGWNVRELAGLYETSEAVIKTRLFRARQKMKQALIRFSNKAGLKKPGMKVK